MPNLGMFVPILGIIVTRAFWEKDEA